MRLMRRAQPAIQAVQPAAPRLAPEVDHARDSARDAENADPSRMIDGALESPGSPLDSAPQDVVEARLGHSFAEVRVHTDARAAASARAIGARAYTVGNEIVFAEGRYAPGTAAGQRLLAHELAHVVQQRDTAAGAPAGIGRADDPLEAEADRAADAALAGRSAAIETRVGAPRIMRDSLKVPEASLGSAKTSAPLARNAIDPRRVMVGELQHETELLQQAKTILSWIEQGLKLAAPTQAGNKSGFSFSAQELFDDVKLRARLQPPPKSADELFPVLDLLIDYQIVQRPIYYTLDAAEPRYGVIAAGGALTNKGRLETAIAEITAFATKFAARAGARDPLNPVVATAEIPQAWQGKSTDTTARPRTFAKDVTVLLERLHARNPRWLAGTYATHSWAEFSVDIFLQTGWRKDMPGFYDRDAALAFFDDLNAAAEMVDDKAGKFAWSALYNDTDVAAVVTAKYGTDRVITTVKGHGPDNTHIHLDLRPLDLKRDDVTGYDVVDGRVKLRTPKP